MKLASFNIWGGTIYRPLTDYLKKLSPGTDIFCFQEVFSALPGAPKESSGARMFLFNELEYLLPDFSGFFDSRSTGRDFNGSVNFPVSHGLAVFARKNLGVVSYRSEILEESKNPRDPVEGWTKAQVLNLESDGKQFSLINFHGVGQPGNKLDTPQRLGHMQKLALVWESLKGHPRILCGDFNLYPETEAIKIMENLGENLIKKFDIKNTRNEMSWKKYPGSPQHFADYAFIDTGVKVNSFEVPYNEVSDHLAMILDFKI